MKQYSGEAKYLFLVGYDKTTSNLTNNTADAAVIFTDGTMQTIKVNVIKTNENLADKNGNYTKPYDKLEKAGAARYNAWFKYSVDKNDVYTLDDVDHFVNVKADSKFDSINVENVRLTDSTKRAYGNDDSIYITVETKKDATDNGIAINKVKSTYTGVQNVNLKVETAAASSGTNQTIENSVFAVYDGEGYIIAAIVRGTEGTASENYAYAVKGAQNEYVLGDDDYYYWDFKAVQDGEYKTLTVKTEYASVIDKIQSVIDVEAVGKNSLLKLTLDKDGYVTDVILVDGTESDVYGKSNYLSSDDIDPKIFDAYTVTHSSAKVLKAVGRTLYTGSAKDVGLTLVSGAPVVVLQKDADGDLSVEEYTSIAQAIDALEDVNPNTKDVEFKGVIAAVLNDKGTAEFLVLSSATQLSDNSKDDDKKVSKVDTLYAYAGTNSIKLNVGMTQAVSSETKVDVTIKVLNGGTWVDVDTYTVVIAKGDKTGTALTVDGLAAGQYKVICGDLSKTVAVK